MKDAANGSRVDTVVIGGSAGSLEAISRTLRALPETLPASVIVVQHLSPEGQSSARQLARHSALPVQEAEDGMDLHPGQVYVAPPDRHLLLGHGHLHLRRGAHENNFRPAVDPLFRSAAVYRGAGAVGVIYSGYLNDGSAGARALANAGATVIVQDPDTAQQASMPQAVLHVAPGAEILTPEAIAVRLADLAGTPCAAPGPADADVLLELKIATLEGATMENENRLGTLSPYNCPHCNGVLWEIEDGPMLRFRCHTGHAYTVEALSEAQERAVDEKLFNALRAHRGRISLLTRMAQSTSSGAYRTQLMARVSSLTEDTERLEGIILNRRSA